MDTNVFLPFIVIGSALILLWHGLYILIRGIPLLLSNKISHLMDFFTVPFVFFVLMNLLSAVYEFEISDFTIKVGLIVIYGLILAVFFFYNGYVFIGASKRHFYSAIKKALESSSIDFIEENSASIKLTTHEAELHIIGFMLTIKPYTANKSLLENISKSVITQYAASGCKVKKVNAAFNMLLSMILLLVSALMFGMNFKFYIFL